ncbi:MAG TPA: AAA family ATPase, partial [Gemmataceae bacterium]|nr:AAA family ATPase [Gemmataceae bacterium]
MSASPSDDRSAPARPASQIIPQPIEWLWPGRLACGKLAMLDGDPERGKSLVTLDLCARLSTGRPLPDGSPVSGPCNSLVLNGEDGTADTFQPRLKSLGADLDRVFFLHGETSGAIEPLRLPTQASVLAAALVQTGARLVVIDPIMAFLDQWVLTSSDQSVRRALFPLAQLAELHRCVIILVRHFNKTAGRHAM